MRVARRHPGGGLPVLGGHAGTPACAPATTEDAFDAVIDAMRFKRLRTMHGGITTSVAPVCWVRRQDRHVLRDPIERMTLPSLRYERQGLTLQSFEEKFRSDGFELQYDNEMCRRLAGTSRLHDRLLAPTTASTPCSGLKSPIRSNSSTKPGACWTNAISSARSTRFLPVTCPRRSRCSSFPTTTKFDRAERNRRYRSREGGTGQQARHGTLRTRQGYRSGIDLAGTAG